MSDGTEAKGDGAGPHASEGTGPHDGLQRRLGRRLEEVAKAVGGGCCRLQMPLRPALGVGGTVAGHRLRALEGEGGGSQMPWRPGTGGQGQSGGGHRLRPPRVTFRRVVVPLRGPGQSPVLHFACCVGSLRSVGRCGRCSRCWRFRVRGAQSLVCRGCAECGGMCRLRVSGAQ